MKVIVLIGVMSLVALGIFVALSLMQRQETDKLVQGDASGLFSEKKQERAVAEEFTGKAFEHPTGPSAPSWVGRVPNAIEDCERGIKNLLASLGRSARRPPRIAPAGVYFTLIRVSARNPSGIIGLEAGTQVVCVKDEGAVLLVKAGNLEFEAKREYLTNDLDVAELAVRNDAEAQQAIASYIARQQQAVAGKHNH